MNFENSKKAFLILADGTVFEGKSFGAEGSVIGEVVFTTQMTGYQEILTDPSFCGQIVTQTFPLIGNYGTNDYDYSSEKSVVSGYIVREHCEEPSNFRCQYTIDEFLKKQGVIGLYDIDTRRLTRILRERGVMNGMITNCADFDKEKALEEIKNFTAEDYVAKLSTKERTEFKTENGKYNVALIDYGYKFSIRDLLLKAGCNVTLFPSSTTAEELLEFAPDGIVLSNGPGDPMVNTAAIETLKKLIPAQIPTFGICLGHQLLALANGARTTKLKYGHRGVNQPVADLINNKTLITSQNHGYSVIGDTVPVTAGKVSHINGNDKTCEGIKYVNAPAFSVQFHPASCGSPQDTAYLIDEFVKLMEEK